MVQFHFMPWLIKPCVPFLSLAVFPKIFQATSAKMADVESFYVCHFHFTSAKFKKDLINHIHVNFLNGTTSSSMQVKHNNSTSLKMPLMTCLMDGFVRWDIQHNHNRLFSGEDSMVPISQIHYSGEFDFLLHIFSVIAQYEFTKKSSQQSLLMINQHWFR